MKIGAAVMLLLMTVVEGAGPASGPDVLVDKQVHLGIPGQWEWESFKGRPVDATRLEIRFQGKANAAAQTLKIWQQDVKLPWPVLLNGKPVGALVTSETALENLLTLPPGALQDAENVLTVEAPPTLDDIEVGPVSLHPEPIKEVLKEASLEVTVVDKFNGKGVPCRLTLTKVDGTLQPILAEPAGAVALRVGICYTGDGKAQLSVPVGDYVLHAGRGSEWECGTDRNSLG